ncbi:hypothetical protein D6B98_13210 [Bradyrhizobium sp. LVM 105]|nr:hypothetical protein D6B98_13210 [Bradyrhizobium sp. LVM 105]
MMAIAPGTRVALRVERKDVDRAIIRWRQGEAAARATRAAISHDFCSGAAVSADRAGARSDEPGSNEAICRMARKDDKS